MTDMDVNELDEVSGGIYTGACVRITVQKNDCLASIASRYRTTVLTLRQLNPHVNDPLTPGTPLLVPKVG